MTFGQTVKGDTLMASDVLVDDEKIEELKELVGQFKQILLTETTLMENRTVEALPGLLKQKEQVLQHLQENQAAIIELLKSDTSDASVEQLRQALEFCQARNRENQGVAMVELRQTRDSLDLLRSLLRLDDLPLYSSGGRMTVKREKRNLGSA